ncbi:beta-glucosidase [Frankia sp. Hr75.2]|nr:beta-glucosidase [Frankia sp. Hr75.2]
MTRSTLSPGKVPDLVSRLTLDQKIAQLTGFAVTDLIVRGEGPRPAGPDIDVSRVPSLRPHGASHLSLSWFLGHDAASLRSALDRIQSAVRAVAPFGIGALAHNEAVNGFLHVSGSQFPTAWAQAATWDPALVTRAAAVSAAHMRETGIHLAFSPVMDLARDPRWGRVHETYGEDPELAAQFSVAFVRGVQGPEGDSGLLTTGKHFAGYGASEGGLNQAVTQLGHRALIDEYAEPFRRAITEADLVAVMNSYNELDGVPCAADRWLLTDLLRGQLGFDGIVVSDYSAVDMLRTIYHTASSEGQAAVQALSAGLDVELPGDVNFSHLADEVTSGRLDEHVLDTAVARVLTVKARVGLIPGMAAPRAASAAAPPDRLDDDAPLYAFGHGLSYSSFDIALDESAGPAVEEIDGLLRARLVVSNTSAADGETVVQLYARDEAATVVRPVRQLLGFTRLALAAGETRRVLLEAPVERLFYTMADGTRGLEAGDVTVLAALSSDDIHCSRTVPLSARRA